VVAWWKTSMKTIPSPIVPFNSPEGLAKRTNLNG
jgi:hypothetical protein